jgi:hypothetical protein
MILQVLAHAGQGVPPGYRTGEQLRVADAGALQDLRRGDRARAQQHFFIGRRF